MHSLVSPTKSSSPTRAPRTWSCWASRAGYPLAVRLAAKIAAADPTVDPAAIVGQLDVTMFRDDLSHRPAPAVPHAASPHRHRQQGCGAD